MKKLSYKPTIALIGAGYWGKNLARNFFELGALHTICDVNLPLLETYREKYPEVPLVNDFEKVLDTPEIKQIVIAAPAFKHFALAKQALEKGKDVYVEKPLCMTSKEGEELIKIAEKNARILMVGHLLHYHPYVQKIQEMIGSGEIGKLQYIISNRMNLGSYRTEENALWNFAPHDISVILSLCGHRLPTGVRCVGDAYLSKGVADMTMTTLQFEGGVRSHNYVSWLHPFKEQKLTVIGSDAMIVFDDTLPWDEKLVIYRNHVKWVEGHIPQVDNNQAEPVVVPQKEPLKEECLHFLKSCQERTIPKTDGHEGLRVLKVLQAAQSSLVSNGELRCPNQEHDQSLVKPKAYDAHPSAIIDPSSSIGKGCKIWQFSHVMKGALLGDECNLGQNVVVSPDVTLGKNVKVQNNVSIYSGVTCEDHVFLGPSMVFTNITNPRSEIVRRDQYLPTLIRKGATIGANATILCGIEIGSYAFIGAGAVVTKDVKPHSLILGNPGRHVGWMSRAGFKLDLPPSLAKGEEKRAVCPDSGEEYILKGEVLEYHTSREPATV